MIITTEHNKTEFVPAHIRLRDTTWNQNKFEERDYKLSYYQQAKTFVERVYNRKFASHGRSGTLEEGIPESIWYPIG